jgi:hypothetical protein
MNWVTHGLTTLKKKCALIVKLFHDLGFFFISKSN